MTKRQLPRIIIRTIYSQKFLKYAFLAFVALVGAFVEYALLSTPSASQTRDQSLPRLAREMFPPVDASTPPKSEIIDPKRPSTLVLHITARDGPSVLSQDFNTRTAALSHRLGAVARFLKMKPDPETTTLIPFHIYQASDVLPPELDKQNNASETWTNCAIRIPWVVTCYNRIPGQTIIQIKMSLYYDYPMFSQELVLDLERSRGSDISQLISQFEMPRISCGEKCWNSLYLPAESIFFKYRTMEKRATRNVYCLECKIMRLNTCLNTLHDDRIFIYSSFALLDIFTLAFLDDVRDQKPARFKPEKLAEESLSDNARQRGSRLLPIFQEAVKELYSGSIYAPTRRQGPTPVCGLTAPE